MTEEIAAAIEFLVPIVKDLYATHAEEIERHKAGQSQMNADDFLWRRLLVSMATMGNSRGWDGLIGNADNYQRVTFEALSGLDPSDRREQLRNVLRRANVRWPDQKAAWLAEDFERIMALGGLQAANETFRAMNDRGEIIAFLQSFAGIGGKYARNIAMDIYHPAFRDSVAVDQRISRISESLGLSFESFQEHEDFYRKVAAQAGLEGWELDRLLYNFTSEALGRLQSTGATPPAVEGVTGPGPVPPVEPNQHTSGGPSAAPAPPPADANATGAHDDLFQALRQAFRNEFPGVHSYQRPNGWFYGQGTHVFFVARPRRTGRVEVRLHASKDQLPDTYLELVEKPHSGRADPPVQFTVIESHAAVPEVMRLAHFAHRFWGGT